LGEAPEVATTLYGAATALFILTGAGVILRARWRTSLALLASVESLAFLLLFWDGGLIVGIAIDIAILVTLAFSRASRQVN
jgi:hypothetical protein